MLQSWSQLLFVHWRYEPSDIQALLPPGLTVDTWDGSAWVAIVPFFMRNIRPTWFPAVPHISHFLELNVRTYAINEQGVPGVWFFSLAANRRLAVLLARKLFRLPYHFSRMSATQLKCGAIDYRCRRRSATPAQEHRYVYRPSGTPVKSAVGTLEFFLLERYVLFAQLADGSLATGQVHHQPYPVQPATLEHCDASILALDGLDVPGTDPDSVLYSPGVNVEVFGLQRVKLPSAGQ